MQTLLLSKSRLNAFCLCPEKYRLTYVENIRPERTPVNMIEGSAIHHVVENSLVYGNIENIAEASSDEYWSNIKFQNTEYASEGELENARIKTLAESKAFLEKIGKLNTWRMETYFEHPLVNPVTGEVDDSILLRGYTDIIDKPRKDFTRVIDIKTTAKSPCMEQANRALELTVYAYLVACSLGFHIELPVSLLYLVRTKEPKVVWLESVRKMDDFISLYETIIHVAAAIRQGLFWKNHGTQCAWCQHQQICFGKPLAA